MKELTEKDVIEIIEKELPGIIERHPEIKRRIWKILEEKAATKDDIEAILLELQRQREETNKRFEEVNRRFEALQIEMDRRFEEVNRRFEALQMEMDRRFEEVNRRFEALQMEMDRRFEEVNRRFEEMDRRFEALQMEMDRRFEEVTRRFEEMDRRFEELTRQMNDGFEVLRKTISVVGSRWGIGAEGAFRKGFEKVLADLGYEVVKWKKYDKEGRFFLVPRPVEIDIFIRDNKRIAIEVKSSLTYSEVDGFEKAVRFYEEVEGVRVDERIVVAVYAYPGVLEYASKLGINVILGFDEAREYLA